jgi:hypothetical protein
MLNPEFAHMSVTCPGNPRRERERQRRPVLDQQLDDAADVYLFVFVQIEEPSGELVGSLNQPGDG